MTEMITIIAVGVGLAGLILNGQKNILEELRDFKVQVNERLDKMDTRLRGWKRGWARWSVNRRSWKACLRDCAKPYQAGHPPAVKSQG